MKYFLIILFFILTAPAFSQESLNINKKVFHIKVKDSSGTNGETKLYRELLDECYSDIPDVDAVIGDISSTTYFLKGINQVPNEVLKNDWVRDYSATVEVNYMLRQTVLIIATTKSIEGKEPIFQKVHKKQKRTKRFESRHENGDSYGGRSKRRYFHSNEKSALKDARRQAKRWLSQQEAVMCQIPTQTTER